GRSLGAPVDTHTGCAGPIRVFVSPARQGTASRPWYPRVFYIHVAVFVAVNILLHVINFLATPKLYWAFWPLLGWGIGLLTPGLAACRWMPRLGAEWEKRKIRELMEKDRRDA